MLIWTALVTCLSLLTYSVSCGYVARMRGVHGIKAPATTGHPQFEAAYRVQMNTLENLIIYLPALWLFSMLIDQRIAAGLGGLWIVGRLIYARGYLQSPEKRSTGFLISFSAMMILLLGALLKSAWLLV
ncbi:MAPEG family protein [Ampullimonas aquatilis]|uniref:MAPEG family protein n=1 Tax=Ampullimonas aquatilis TaxID=1341549 RepID=UPI003C70DB61